MEKIKVGIIGCGKIANNAHEPAYEAARDIAEVKYFVDIIPERAEALRDKYGSGVAITDYHEILNDPRSPAFPFALPTMCILPSPSTA